MGSAQPSRPTTKAAQSIRRAKMAAPDSLIVDAINDAYEELSTDMKELKGDVKQLKGDVGKLLNYFGIVSGETP